MSGRRYEPGSPEWHQHREDMLREERQRGVKGWWFLSFADDAAHGGFHGGCFVEAFGVATALDEANRLGLNPGGEVLHAPMPPDGNALCERYRDRLLSRAELDAIDAAAGDDDSMEAVN
jgi:hypothetical protein